MKKENRSQKSEVRDQKTEVKKRNNLTTSIILSSVLCHLSSVICFLAQKTLHDLVVQFGPERFNGLIVTPWMDSVCQQDDNN